MEGVGVGGVVGFVAGGWLTRFGGDISRSHLAGIPFHSRIDSTSSPKIDSPFGGGEWEGVVVGLGLVRRLLDIVVRLALCIPPRWLR